LSTVLFFGMDPNHIEEQDQHYQEHHRDQDHEHPIQLQEPLIHDLGDACVSAHNSTSSNNGVTKVVGFDILSRVF
jgi:hypothetical protein